jgi:hypothetical protein
MLKILGPKGMEKLRCLLEEDEDWRFPTIKLNRSKSPKYELPEPTEDDRDNVEAEPTFKAVVLVARKNFYQSDEDKEEGKEAKEKRVLYVLRPGKKVPERIFISPTGLRNWKGFCKAVVEADGQYFTFMCEFSAEHVAPAKSKYQWNKAKFDVDRRLTDEEIAYVEEVRALVDKRVKVYEDESELDKYEDQAMGISRGRDDDDAVDRHSAKRRKDIEDDDEDEPKAKKPGKRSSKKKDDDDDEDEPKGKSGKSGKSKKDDDDEDDDPPAKKKSKKDDDDEDDDPPAKKKSKKDDDDDEDDDPPANKKSGKAGYPDLDDDDDEDLDATKKGKGGKKPSLEDDDDED